MITYRRLTHVEACTRRRDELWWCAWSLMWGWIGHCEFEFYGYTQYFGGPGSGGQS